MANNTFTNTSGGSWSSGSNWSLVSTPDSNAAVTFVSGTYTSTVDSGGAPWTIQSLNVNVATVTLAVDANLTAQVLAGNAGSIDVEASATLTLGSINSNNSNITVSDGAVMTVQNLNGNSGNIVAGPTGLVNLLATGTGNFTVTGGTLQVASNFNGNGTIAMTSGIVWLAGQLGNSAYQFNGNDQLYFDSIQFTTNNVMSGISPGDQLAIKGVTISSANYSGTTLTLNTSGGTYTFTNLTLASDETNGATIGTTTFQGNSYGYIQLACFARGTNIHTPDGEVPVERLAVGDTVSMWDGSDEKIEWIGIGRLPVIRGRRNAATPVIICKGALADDVPHRDLRLTKGHALFIDDVLIPVEFLVNHRSIIWDDRAREIEFYHIELARHGVLIADGAPTESYRDDDNHWMFQNALSAWHPTPKQPCAPVLTGGPVVDAAWRRLLDRAGSRPGLPTTDDPDLHLLVDGVRVDGVAGGGSNYVFALPRRPKTVLVVSRAGVPQELGTNRDCRALGVALRRVLVRWGLGCLQFEAEDSVFLHGFYPFEADNSFRWTDGYALLPTSLFHDVMGPWQLELQVGCTALYPVFNEGQYTAAA